MTRNALPPGIASASDQGPAPPDYSLGPDIEFDRLLLVNNAEMLADERNEIARRRATAGQANDLTNLVGLAISGGGIRSATIALGATQKLAEMQFLRQVDFVSTVSGGGYLGGFITSYLNSDAPDVSAAPGDLPYRRDNNCESAPLRHLRNHSRYILEGSMIHRLRAVGQMIHGLLMNLLGVIYVPIAFALIMHTLAHHAIHRALNGHLTVFAPAWVLAPFIGQALIFVLLSVVQKLERFGTSMAKLRAWVERLNGIWLVFTLFALWFLLQPALFFGFHWVASEIPNRALFAVSLATLVGASPAAVGALAVILRHLPKLRYVLVPLFWISGPIAMLLLYLGLTRALVLEETELARMGYDPNRTWWLIVAILFTYGWFFLNINLTSPHRYYRDQLASTYLLQRVATRAAAWRDEAVDRQPLSKLSATAKAPYHLINATLNTPASLEPELRGRASDFFLFSKHWCGSPLVSYHPTVDWEKMDGHLDLATAIAISGAAASPQMGMTSIRGARFWLAILNIRLNYWLRRPDRLAWSSFAIQLLGGPGAWHLIKEILGSVDHKGRYLNISDGGHLENLAIYELLRRRCKFIIALDGEQDPTISCSGLIKLIRFAWIDFGTRIHIDLSELNPNADGYSQIHYALGKIEYCDGSVGFLLYVKSSLTSNEPNYVLEYRKRFCEFPHQSTLDQLFEEDQFEAYRALGYHLIEETFRTSVIGAREPDNVRAWFQALANHALRR